MLDIKANFTDCCIGCLQKNAPQFDLSEYTNKKNILSTLFNIEFDKFTNYPKFLCSACDEKLNISHSFFQQVKGSLKLLQDYKNKESLNDSNCNKTSVDDNFMKDAFYNETDNILEEELTKENGGISDDPTDEAIETAHLNEVDRVLNDYKKPSLESRTCILCGFIAANKRTISSHMTVHHKDKKESWCRECNNIFDKIDDHKNMHNSKYACPFCEKELRSSHFAEHVQSHAGIFKCDICNKTFKSASWLKKHSRIHTNHKPFQCSNCFKCFIQLSSLRYHIKTHGSFNCDTCKKSFKTEQELKEHECQLFDLCKNEIWIKPDEGHVEDNAIFIEAGKPFGPTDVLNFCKQCNKRVKSVKQHNEKYHNSEGEQEIYHSTKNESKPSRNKNERECEFCQKKILGNTKFRVHIQTHTGRFPYECQYCAKKLAARSQLVAHERTHTKEKPYVCSDCGKAFGQKSALNTHMKQHTGKPEVCHLCNKRFCRKSELKLHMDKHIGLKPFLCPQCGRAFAQQSHLTDHIRGHGEERPYQCDICKMAFKKSVLLKGHQKIHRGHKPFQCTSCPYACYGAYRLQQHMKSHKEGLTNYSDKNEQKI